jgi:diaminopropionate ammonia-lyase
MSSVYINHNRKRLTSLPPGNPKVKTFHESLPHYHPTPLVSLPEIAQQLGIQNLLVKDEGSRLGLPAFKILGASWATAKSVARHTGLESELSLENLAPAAQAANLVLYAATDGNHGRKDFGLPRILVFRSRDNLT